MDAQEFRSLQEAYMEVVENHQLDEEKRPIYGRGGSMRRTQTALQGLGKYATARDKKKLHNIPKGGTTIDRRDPGELMSGEYDRGKGSKAKRRAAALSKPEPKKSFPNRLRRSDGQGIHDSYEYDIYDLILSHLLDEGYAETPEQAEVIMVNMSEGYKKFPYKKVEDKIHKKEADNPTGRGTPQSVKMDTVFRHFKGGKEVRRTEKREYSPQISKAKAAKNKARATQEEQADLYDIILSHLLDEGYAETPEAAEVIMVNMSEEWRESIVEEVLE